MSSTTSTVTGIILSRRDHKEVDRRYSLLTRQRGKMDVMARGGQKALAKLTPHLEFVCEADILLVHGPVLHTVAGVERQRPFRGIYKDLSRLVLAHNSLALLDNAMNDEQPDLTLYEAVRDWLSFLDRAPSLTQERSGFLLGAFALKLSGLLGYYPEFYRCLSCRQFIVSGKSLWHALKGGVVCSSCVARHPDIWFQARAIQDDTIKLLRVAISEPFTFHLRTTLTGDQLTTFHDAVESLLISHFPTIPANSLRGACLAC